MVHIGKILKSDYQLSGKTANTFAKELGFTRTNMYAMFRRPSIDTDTLFRISKALEKDYFAIYSEHLQKKYPDKFHKKTQVNEPPPEYGKKHKVFVEIELNDKEYQDLKGKIQ